MTHPKPEDMAAKRYPAPVALAPPKVAAVIIGSRNAFSAGIAAERARVAAWLREFAVHSHLATILASDLEGK
jgi:hypothetical protein